MSFSDLGISQWLVQQLSSIGISRPTSVQSGVIPHVLRGSDCVACAKTGSGKTLAFALPVIEKLSHDPYGVFAVVLTPTRELALQIGDQFSVLGQPLGLQCRVCIGGRDTISQAQQLNTRPHVLVCTPGRLVDHLSSGCETVSLRRVQFVVLDEADRLIAGRFDDDLSVIFSHLPVQRQTLIFSATCNDTLHQLKNIANNECHYFEDMDEVATVAQLRQSYVLCADQVKDATLVHLTNEFVEQQTGQLIVFVNKCRLGTVLAMTLNRLGIAAVALHSHMKQTERTAALTKFKSSVVRVLVTTDVGSRGLDIPLVDLVINYDTPASPRDYIHRVGRTARAGRGGGAICLLTPCQLHLLTLIEQRIGQQLTKLSVEDASIVRILTEVRVTRRAQELKVCDSEVVQRRRVNRVKDMILDGVEPEQARRQCHNDNDKRIRQIKMKGKVKRS